MIIQCEKCQARFRLDDSKIPSQGRKVRCSKCQNVFFIRKPEAPPPPPPPEPEPDLGFEEEAAAGTPPEDEAASRPHPQLSEEAFEPTVRIDLAAHHEELAYEEEREAPAPPRPRRRSPVRWLLTAVGALVVLAVLAVVLHQLDLLPFLSSSPPESPTANLVIDQNKLKGEWEKNAQVSKVFVINGVVQNQSKKPRAFIKVRGLLLDRGGKQLKATVAFCGNAIPTQDLRTKAPAEIQNSMKNREGLKGVNTQIAPGAFIPFTIVFFDVPEGVETFGAEVVEAQIPGTQ